MDNLAKERLIVRTCATCGREFPADANPRRVTCSTSCRVRRHYRQRAEDRRLVLADLRAAAVAGDLAAVRSLTARASRLLAA